MQSQYLPFGRPDFGDAEILAVTRVLRSGWIGMGPEVIKFEQELAEFVGARAVVTVSSCTSALFLALVVQGVGAGDEVIVPSLTWCSTANAVLYVGATPIFCDVDPRTCCLTPETVTACLSPRTKAVIPVHFGGLPADIVALRDCLPGHVILIEDAAHAFGARYRDGRHVGESGNLVCFSFYANKNLSTGEGGAIALSDRSIAERLQRLRLHGLKNDAWQRFTCATTSTIQSLTELGYKMNYSDILASIGRVQLSRQCEFRARRLAIAEVYVEGLRRMLPSAVLQTDILSELHARHLFIVQVPLMPLTRDEWIVRLRAANIGATVHYTPLHLMPLYSKPQPISLPQTEDVCARILTLPISASMTTPDAVGVLRALQDILHLTSERGRVSDSPQEWSESLDGRATGRA